MAILSAKSARRVILPILIVLWTLAPSRAFAQDGDRSSFLGSVVKQVVLDPTTYAPSILVYDASMRDWNSSQPFFRSGMFVEHNAEFTVSGRQDDVPVDYATGKRQILTQSLNVFGVSLAHNFGNAMLERMLVERYPEHKKLVRVLGTAERIAVASLMTYRLAGPHYRQWQRNEQMAGQIGFRVSIAIPIQ